MSGRSPRSVDFDANKVRLRAAHCGIRTVAALDARYRSHHKNIPPEQNATVVEKAWRGQRADRKHADRLAQCLGLADCTTLLRNDTGGPSWTTLVTADEHRDPFLHFVSDANRELRLVKMRTRSGDDDLPRVPLDSTWHLELLGKSGQALFIALRSESRFFQLAPVRVEGFHNRFEGSSLRYPQARSLEFNPDDGTGWRQFIAIRADSIPILHRDDSTGYECTHDELELLARHLLERSRELRVNVATYEFLLTEPE